MRIRQGIVIILLVVCASAAFAGMIVFFQWFGAVTITENHIARVNVSLLNNPEGDPNLANATVLIEIFFFDSEGKVLARSGQHKVPAGKTVHWDFAGACPADPVTGVDCVPGQKGARQIRAGVVVTGETSRGVDPTDFVAATMELWDIRSGNPQAILLPAVQSKGTVPGKR